MIIMLFGVAPQLIVPHTPDVVRVWSTELANPHIDDETKAAMATLAQQLQAT
jgi:hypothetical protein